MRFQLRQFLWAFVFAGIILSVFQRPIREGGRSFGHGFIGQFRWAAWLFYAEDLLDKRLADQSVTESSRVVVQDRIELPGGGTYYYNVPVPSFDNQPKEPDKYRVAGEIAGSVAHVFLAVVGVLAAIGGIVSAVDRCHYSLDEDEEEDVDEKGEDEEEGADDDPDEADETDEEVVTAEGN